MKMIQLALARENHPYDRQPEVPYFVKFQFQNAKLWLVLFGYYPETRFCENKMENVIAMWRIKYLIFMYVYYRLFWKIR